MLKNMCEHRLGQADELVRQFFSVYKSLLHPPEKENKKGGRGDIARN